MQAIYKEIVSSKTGFKIPVLENGKTIESRYNPEIDVERKIQSIKKDDLFYLVIGLGSGLFVSKLSEENKSATILVLENSATDIEFLKSLPEIKKLETEKHIHVCLIEDLEKTLPTIYIPALHGNMNIIEQPNYLSAFQDNGTFIKEKINSAIKNIMADFSVQAHFGKIWQRNIMENLSICKQINKIDFPTKKTAVILAAGPTLDFAIKNILSNRGKYFLIATDTTFSTAMKTGITPDVVVSIDGQLVSENHFLHKISSDTLFVFDLCANPSSTKKAMKFTDNVLFIESGHPLAKFTSLSLEKKNSETNCSYFQNLFSGSGTVTITAIDFALKAGFSKIEVVGADFSYTNGKPYTKGTYLDSLYNKNSNRISTSEQTFSKLMYRTELIKINENSYTTTVLDSYRKSLEDYLTSTKIEFKKENNVYYLSKKKIKNSTNDESDFFQTKTFSYPDFYKSIISLNESIDLSEINYSLTTEISPLIISVLPYIAHLRLSNPNLRMQEMVKLALKNLLRYKTL